jgi:hypothetical protein
MVFYIAQLVFKEDGRTHNPGRINTNLLQPRENAMGLGRRSLFCSRGFWDFPI